MNNINALVSKYDEIYQLYNEETDEIEKKEYKSQLDIFSNMIKVELLKEQERGNCSPEFIALCGRFDATIDVEKNEDIDKNEEESKKGEQQTTEKKEEEINIPQEEKELYTLASDKIISRLTGEEIDISNLNKIEKTKVIYYHTEQKITYQDPEIMRLCEIRVNEFLNSCNPDMYKRQYGENWQEQVAKIYQENYLRTFQSCISSGIREMDDKIREEAKKSNQEFEDLSKEIEEEHKIVVELKKETDELGIRASEISKKIEEESKKEELTKLQEEKTKLELIKDSIIKTNTPKTYSDGTLMPDNMDEFGRFTTHRDRTNETGMQERVNDAAHVHDELNDMERIKLQRKFEKIFMDTPMYEEEIPPKSR